MDWDVIHNPFLTTYWLQQRPCWLRASSTEVCSKQDILAPHHRCIFSIYQTTELCWMPQENPFKGQTKLTLVNSEFHSCKCHHCDVFSLPCPYPSATCRHSILLYKKFIAFENYLSETQDTPDLFACFIKQLVRCGFIVGKVISSILQ